MGYFISVMISAVLIFVLVNSYLINKSVYKSRVVAVVINTIIVTYFCYEQLYLEVSIESEFAFDVYFGTLVGIFLIGTLRLYSMYVIKSKRHNSLKRALKGTKWDLFAKFNENDELLDVSESFLRIMGLAKRDALGYTLDELFKNRIRVLEINGVSNDNKTLKVMHARLRSNPRKDNTVTTSLKVVNFKGEESNLYFHETPIFISKKYYGKMMIGNIGITEQIYMLQLEKKELEDKLETTRKRYTNTLSVLNDSVYYIMPDKEVYWLSSQAQSLLKIRENYIDNEDFISLIYPDDYVPYSNKLPSLHNGESATMHYRLNIDGNFVWVKDKIVLSDDVYIGNIEILKTKALNSTDFGGRDKKQFDKDVSRIKSQGQDFILLAYRLANKAEIISEHGKDAYFLAEENYISRLVSKMLDSSNDFYYTDDNEYCVIIKNRRTMEMISEHVKSNKLNLDMPLAISNSKTSIKYTVAVISSEDYVKESYYKSLIQTIEYCEQNNIRSYFYENL